MTSLPLSESGNDNRFTVSWRRGQYFVSRPCWDGGEVVEAVEYDRLRGAVERLYVELKEAHTWLEAAGIDDCEHRGSEGTKLCRFAEALRALEGPANA